MVEKRAPKTARGEGGELIEVMNPSLRWLEATCLGWVKFFIFLLLLNISSLFSNLIKWPMATLFVLFRFFNGEPSSARWLYWSHIKAIPFCLEKKFT